MNRKQAALLKANTQGLIALITGDEQGAQKALNQASKTGIETDLSYLIRAMSAIQADRFDVAEEILNQEKAKVGEHSHALVVLPAGEEMTLFAESDCHAVLFGGAPLDGPRRINWNFVASDPAAIDGYLDRRRHLCRRRLNVLEHGIAPR